MKRIVFIGILRIVCILLAFTISGITLISCDGKDPVINDSKSEYSASNSIEDSTARSEWLDESEPSEENDSSSQSSSEPADLRLYQYEKFLQKVQRGETVYIAFLGGSITAGGSYYNWTDPHPFVGINIDGTPFDVSEYWSYTDDLWDSWRGRVFTWLKDTYEVNVGQFVQINAAIGGTNSEFGALRLEDHVFSYGTPDLIFIEFAVNDNSRNNFEIRSSYESIVNRVKLINPNCAILIPLSTSRQKSDVISPDFYDVIMESLRITKEYADFKGIPYADIDEAYYHSGLTTTQMTALYYGPKDDAGSSVHPSPYGHEIYANKVIDVLQSCFTDFEFDFNETDIPQPFPLPNSARLYFGEDILDALPGSVATLIANDPRGAPCVSDHQMLLSTSLTNEFRFEFEGTGVWLWMDFGYTNYKVDVYIDDVLYKSDMIFGGNQVQLLSRFLSSENSHVLRIVPKSAADPLKPYSFGLRGIMIAN